MAILKACVRRKRSDGFWPVYIRVTHRRALGYIKTDKVVTSKELTKDEEIKDAFVLKYCSELIINYQAKLNHVDISMWSVAQIIEYLLEDSNKVSFTSYAQLHIGRMINRGQERNAKNYKLALGHFQRFMGTTEIYFSDMSSTVLIKWLETLANTHRAKEMYPTCLRQIFKAAWIELNDDEKGIFRIKFNPWPKVKIPHPDSSTKLAISAEECREFFNRPLPESKFICSVPKIGRDVAMMILCLGGINTVDLFNLKKTDYRNGRLCYCRAKTKHARADQAYMEMRVEPFIKPVFDQYLSQDENDEYLFIFHKRFASSDSFGANVNCGIRTICLEMGMKKEECYCCYTFRHTWGTIAQNDCGANLYEVAFGMNHTHGLRVTRGYIKMDFTPAWELNAKVIDFIFYSNKPSKQGLARDIEHRDERFFRMSPKRMVYARAYFKGNKIAEFTDIGLRNIDEVIDRLAKDFPKDIPVGCTVQIRITDCDTEKEAVYERCKGKGF
jgi:integrase